MPQIKAKEKTHGKHVLEIASSWGKWLKIVKKEF